MDTAITWCRDNGWAPEYISACQYYPAIGSVNYITDEGGPTVVFDQFPTGKGLTPPVPLRVGIGFPKRNRMLLFKGDRFHGVTVFHPSYFYSHFSPIEKSHLEFYKYKADVACELLER